MELYFCPNPRRYLGKLKLGATYVRSKTAGAVMFRPITVAAVLSITLGAIGAANAATYCASGGPERATSRSQCTYSSLADCRAGVQARGGGRCHKKGRYAAWTRWRRWQR